MYALYPFIIAFILIFLAELGDKTQLLVLSFSSKSKVHNILLGIAIGSLLSHGIAIIFGSTIANFENNSLLHIMKLITYITFLILGIVGFLPERIELNKENKIIKKLGNSSLNYIFIIAICIMLGEIGDKTFIASIGLGIEYPNFKIALIIGAILGMVMSNSIAIIFGKVLQKKFPEKYIKILSSTIFLLFGLIGLFFEI